LDRLHLDGYVSPAITSWVNMLGIPAVVVVGGFHDSGLPFGLEPL
jgi:amidase